MNTAHFLWRRVGQHTMALLPLMAAAVSLAGPARAAADLTEGLPTSSPISVPTVDIDGAVGAAADVIRVSASC